MTDLAPPAWERGAEPDRPVPDGRSALPGVSLTTRPDPRPGLRRGRHATARGQGFGYQVGWTLAGLFVPGAGLVAAGWRRVGLFFVGLFVLGLLGLAVFVTFGDAQHWAIKLATDRQLLLVVALVVTLAGLAWAAVMVAGNVALSTLAAPRRAQRLLNGALVLSLVAAVGLPTFEGARYALITRDVLGTVFPTTTSSNAAKPLAKANPWADLPRVNVMLLGGDNGKGRIGVRPDTIIVASIDTTTGDTVLFSLPRNLTHAPFPKGTPGHTAWPDGFTCRTIQSQATSDTCLLNAVWTWATDHPDLFPGDNDPGLTATTQAVEGVTGLDINYYAMANLQGFQQIVNALGGITVNVDRDIPIGGGHNQYTGAANKIYGYITKGENKRLNGHDALWFARSREGSTDYDRMQRQRCVLGAIAKEADPLTLVTSYPALAQAAKDNLSTSIPAQDLDEWAELAIKIKKTGIRSLPFTNKVINSANPDFDEIHRLVKKALVPPETTPTASATASATAGATSSPTATPSPSATATADASEAVRVDQVC